MTRQQLEAELRPLLPGYLRAGKIIACAMCVSIAFFVGVIAVVSASHPAARDGLRTVQLLTYVMLGFGLLLWVASFVMPRLNAGQLPAALNEGATPALAVHRSTQIVTLALRVAAAFFGLVVALIGALNGNLHVAPWIWVNALPAGAFVLLALLTLPSHVSVRRDLERALALD